MILFFLNTNSLLNKLTVQYVFLIKSNIIKQIVMVYVSRKIIWKCHHCHINQQLSSAGSIIRWQNENTLNVLIVLIYFRCFTYFYRTTCFNITDRKLESWNHTCLPWRKQPTIVCRLAKSTNRVWYLARAVRAKLKPQNSFCSTCARWPATSARGSNSRYSKLIQFWNRLVRTYTLRSYN